MRSLVLLTFCIYEAFAQKPCISKTFAQKPCISKTFPGLEPRIVCVCNATYCDEFPPIGSLEQLEAAVYTPSISRKRFQKDLQNWVSGWTEWNLCLDEQGGPTWVGTNVHGLDPVIVVNNTIDEFYKEPMYYILGHFSKFIRPDSTRIQMSFDCLLSSISLNGVAFVTPSNQTVVVIHNTDKLVSYQVSIRSQNPNLVGKELKLTIDPQSIHTIVWEN